MKSLPWFKFEPNEYLAGDVQLCSLEAQAIFVNVCALYWKGECCSIARAKLEHRLRIDKALLNRCLDELDEWHLIIFDDDSIGSITFLDEQWKELGESHQKRVNAGRKGGQNKALAMLQQSSGKALATPSNIEEDIDTEVEEDKDTDTVSVNPDPEALFSDDKTDEPMTPISEADQWRCEIAATDWAKSFKRAGGKIGPNNWLQWEGLKSQFTVAVIVTGIQKTTVDKWPGDVEQTINRQNLALRGDIDETPSNVVRLKLTPG